MTRSVNTVAALIVVIGRVARRATAGIVLSMCLSITTGWAADEPPAQRIEGPPIINAPSNPSMPGMPNEGRAPPAAKPNATVQQPRQFGYVIGDVFTQRVLLALEGHPFVPAEIPTPGRAGIWFERRAIRTETDASGQRWLAVDYQLMNSPQAVAVATIPPWKMKSKSSGAELRVAEWPMTVGPLTPEKPFTRTGLGALRPDRQAELVSIEATERTLTAAVVLMTLTLASWVGWWAWRNWRASSSQPFAHALREMRNVDDAAPEAWLALHRAFDSTAGRTLRSESLASWFHRAPQFESLRPAIERFFSESATRFFAGRMPEQAVSVHALCRDLRRIEKRQEP
jgi:mxaA protein